MQVRIKRFNDSGKEVLGAVFVDNKPFCLSLEQEWNSNKVGNSCIPVGEYICEWHESPKYGWCYSVENVSGRSHILFHKGNVAKNTKGCILLGEKLGVLNGSNAVLISEKTVRSFNKKMERKQFKLIIE